MNATLTIPLDKKLHTALRRRARLERKDATEIARELLADGLERRSDWDKVKKLAGCLRLPKTFDDPLRQRIRENNWRS